MCCEACEQVANIDISASHSPEEQHFCKLIFVTRVFNTAGAGEHADHNTVMKHDGWWGAGHQEGRCGDGSEQLLKI